MSVVANGNASNPVIDLDPAKRYFVSVLPNKDYQMGGALVKAGQASVTVRVNRIIVPTAQISVFSFNDNQPINNATTCHRNRIWSASASCCSPPAAPMEFQAGR